LISENKILISFQGGLSRRTQREQRSNSKIFRQLRDDEEICDSADCDNFSGVCEEAAAKKRRVDESESEDD